jgi:signal transduction histidine kinase
MGMGSHSDSERQARQAGTAAQDATKSTIGPVKTENLPSGGPEEALEQIAKRAREAVKADLAAIVAEVPGGMHVLGGVDGIGENDLRGLVLGPANGSRLWRELLAQGRPYIVDDVASDERLSEIAPPLTLGRLMMIPLASGGLTTGALLLAALPGRAPFGTLDLDIATVFARGASEALDLIRSREFARRLATSEDHRSVARDMHDEVLQRLFAVAMQLQAVAKGVAGSPADALDNAIVELHETTDEIRSTIFTLRAAAAVGPTLRDELLDISLSAIETLGFDVHLRTVGGVDIAVPTLRRPLRALLEEALAGIAHQAAASRVDLLVTVTRADVTVEIRFDGAPLPDNARDDLLSSAHERMPHGGTIDIDPTAADAGTTLIWSAPIPHELRT